MQFDVIVIGSGPAGTSAALPLVKSGKKVLMLDWGNKSDNSVPSQSHYNSRESDDKQSNWMIGKDLFSLKNNSSVSPKLRIPTLEYVFRDFEKSFSVDSDNFFYTGSMATGGLSNAWGAGVAALSPADLIKEYGSAYREMLTSYANVSPRLGISGSNADKLSTYFNVDRWADKGVDLDDLPKYILEEYDNKSESSDVVLGRARIAVLSKPKDDRKECDSLGNCLWGCKNESIYSAKYEMRSLMKSSNFKVINGVAVTNIKSNENRVYVSGFDQNGGEITFDANSVFLGAGTLSTSKILVKSLAMRNSELRIQSCPTAAFLLFVPRFFGRKVSKSEFGLGQVSFKVKLTKKLDGFGSFFGTQGLPLYEFVRHLPIGISSGARFLSSIINSCMVGNLFLPGTLSTSKMIVDERGEISLSGSYDDSYRKLGSNAKIKLVKQFARMKCFMVPFSFKFTEPGACIHYASTFPISESNEIGTCRKSGEVVGLKNVYVVDGASLPSLSEKSHTLTIMANSDRIARNYISRTHK